MNIHKNARLTAQGRHLLVRRVEELGWRMVEAAKAAGISQRQGYRALVQIPSTRKHSLLRYADFRPKALRSRLQVQLGLERSDVPV
jgi:hypothetical protein